MSDWQQLVDRACKEPVGSNWTHMGCEHKELELKRYNPEGKLVDWYECKKCHQTINL